MNSIKKHPVLLIALFCAQFMYSQFTEIGDAYNRFDSSVKTFDISNEPVDGSPYLYKEYSPAKISLLTNICLVNFDAYLDNMEIERNDKIYYLPKNDFTYTIKFQHLKTTYQLFNFEKRKLITPGFFVVLKKEKDFYLLKKQKIKKLEAKKAKNGYDKSRPITFIKTKDSYYISFKNHNALKIPSSKKQFSLLFTPHNKEIYTYIKEHRINPKKEKDLLKVCNYYTTIN